MTKLTVLLISFFCLTSFSAPGDDLAHEARDNRQLFSGLNLSLAEACKNGSPAQVNALLPKLQQFSLNEAADSILYAHPMTPLMALCQKESNPQGRLYILNKLLESGADPRAEPNGSGPILVPAALNLSPEALQVLIISGVRMELTDAEWDRLNPKDTDSAERKAHLQALKTNLKSQHLTLSQFKLDI